MALTLTQFMEQLGHGSTRALARAIGANEADVSAWRTGKRLVPAHHAVGIERWSRGRVTVEDLRGELPWVRVVEAGWPDGKPVLDVEAAKVV